MTTPFENVELVVIQNAVTSKGFVWQQTDTTQTPPVTTSVSLAGYSVQSQIRKRAGGTLMLDISEYIELEPDGVTGRILITIPASASQQVTDDGVWDLFLVPSDPDQTVKLIEGVVTLDRAVTQVGS